MKTSVVKILSLILSLFMLVSVVGCNNQEDTNTSSDDVIENSSEIISSEEDISSEEPVSSEEEVNDDSSTDDYVDEHYVEYVSVKNSQTPIMTNYRGVSSSVYHGSTYMNDAYGRNYTEEMAQMEFDRLTQAGIKYARTYFRSQWAWDADTKQWNWDSTRMNGFYKWAKALQDRGVNIILTTGWHFDKPIIATTDQNGDVKYNYTSGINDAQYIYGNEPGVDNLYGELDGYDFSGMTDDEVRIRKIGLRLGEWAKQAIKALRDRGINNVSHVLVFVEPTYATAAQPEGPHADELLNCVTGFKQAFRRDGSTNNVLIMGPNQGSIKHGNGMLRYALERQPDLYDVMTAHFYPRGTTDLDDVYGDMCDNTFKSYTDTMAEFNMQDKKEFWCDEFYASSTQIALGSPNPWGGVNTCVGLVTAMKYKIQNTSLWQIFDQLWINQTNTAGEFSNGIHVVGSAPSLLVSSIPKPQYYAVSLLGRYLGNNNGTVYPVEVPWAHGIYMNAVKREDGNWTVVVINVNLEPVSVQVSFDRAINSTLYRHVYDANEPKASTAAHLADPDRVFKNVQKTLYDTVPSGGVAVYTSCKF